jgi:prevent-host-death family protein
VKKVNIHEAKTQLSKLLQRVATGEEIAITNRGVPVAHLVPAWQPKVHRELGIESEHVKIGEDFDSPLPTDAVIAFLGGQKKQKGGKGVTADRMFEKYAVETFWCGA